MLKLRRSFSQWYLHVLSFMTIYTQIETDYQPLVAILNKPLHMAAARLQTMMRVQKYDFVISYKQGKQMYLVDTLSRAPIKNTEVQASEKTDFEVLSVEHISSSRLVSLKEHTATDPTL